MAEPERLAEAVARRPSLHRYIKRVPAFILEASRIVMERYDGDAGSIWANEPRAADLQRRLREFPGISQKKAAMAVEILERDLRVPVRELGGSDIAFDVHIRRVFLRTGLAEDDDADHMINIARRLHPERPGALDPPTWIVGRSWCHPANPDCRACVLDSVCAHRIEIGREVRGAS
jgi:endonuclease III